MSQLPESQSDRQVGGLHITAIVFVSVACMIFLVGSILVYLSWVSPAMFGISPYYAGEGSFITTILGLLVMMPLFWLFGTIALLLERRWILATLLLPVTIALFIGCYLFLTFVAFHVPGGPNVSLLLLFVPLNALLFILAWRLMIGRVYVRG